MQQNLIDDNKLDQMAKTPALEPFDDRIVDFLNLISKLLREDKESRQYPDIVTLSFFVRKSSILSMKERFLEGKNSKDGNRTEIILGRGLLFHIAPSNVPVNFAYSLVAGLVTGNANIVRVPSKDFAQVEIVERAIEKAVSQMPQMADYVYLVKYDRSKEINDKMSSLCDVRIIWGGDNTIAEIRKSHLPPRSTEVTFADRYSLAVIDSDTYLNLEDKDRFAEGFYNDTYLTDQNACTSPRVVVWTGSSIEKAKDLFWEKLHELVEKKYTFQPIMGVNKLTNSYILLSDCTDEKNDYKAKVLPHKDNLIVRIALKKVDNRLMDYKDNSGYFFEYDCNDLLELKELCDDNHCQTIGYLGDFNKLIPLLTSGIKGVDRVVPIGKTMDFDLVWDGYNLFERFTRVIALQ